MVNAFLSLTLNKINTFGNVKKLKDKSQLRTLLFPENNENRNNVNIHGKEDVYLINERKKVNIILHKDNV